MLLAPVSVFHDELPRLAQNGVIGIERGPDGAATVAGGWLNVQLLNRCFTHNPSVRNAIESHPSCHAESLDAELFMNLLSHGEQDLFGDGLDTCRDIRVVLVLFAKLVIVCRFVPEVRRITGGRGEKERFRIARRTEEIYKARVECLLWRMVKGKIVHVEFKAAVLRHSDKLIHLIDVLGLAEGCHSHYFVFTFVYLETEKRSEGTIKKPQRMGKADLFEQLDVGAFADTHTSGCPLPDSIDRQNSCLFKGRAEKRARGV